MVYLSEAAISALSDLLDVNDDDDVMLEGGINPAGLAELRNAVTNHGKPDEPAVSLSPLTHVTLTRPDSTTPDGAAWLSVAFGEDPNAPETSIEALVSVQGLADALSNLTA